MNKITLLFLVFTLTFSLSSLAETKKTNGNDTQETILSSLINNSKLDNSFSKVGIKSGNKNNNNDICKWLTFYECQCVKFGGAWCEYLEEK
mgnify:CR=1 FL=1